MALVINPASSTPNKPTAWQQLCFAVLACLTMLMIAVPAQAGVTLIQSIDGIKNGQRVQGSIDLGATAAGDANEIHYKLTGPVEIQVVRSGKQSSFVVDDNGDPLPWDTTAVPDGQYKLVVYSTRNGEVDRFQFVKFQISNLTKPAAPITVQKPNTQSPATPQPATEEPATEEPATEEPATEEPATEEPATEEPATEEPATEEPATEEPATVQPAPETTVEEQPTVNLPTTDTPTTTEPEAPTHQPVPAPAPAPAPSPVNTFAMTFANGATAYTTGSGQSIPLTVTGEMSDSQDLMVLAWSVAENRMVAEFAFTLKQGPWEIPADQLAKLPAGVNNLQLHLRDNGSTIKRVTRDVTFAAPVTPFVIGFANAPAAYELGSGKAITLDATGDLAQGVDVLVLAWSTPQAKLVEAFSFTIDSSPWTIPASKLDALPEGENELQLIVRDDKRTKLTHRLNVSAPAPALPDVSLQKNLSFTRGQASADMAVQFSTPVPSDCDIVVLAWSPTEQRMVHEFVHTLDNRKPVITADKLNLLPVGDNSVRLQIRKRGEILMQVSTDVRVNAIVVPTPPTTDPTPEPTTPDPTTDPTNNGGSTPDPTTDPTNNGGSTPDPTTDPTNNGNSTTDPTTNPTTDPATDPVIEQPTTDPAPQQPATDPVAAVEPVAHFVDTPAQYTPGTSGAMNFTVENLPAGGDVLIIAWSNAQGGLVDEFAHVRNSAPWQISAAQMNKLPAGAIELQLIVRGGNTRPKVTHRIEIVAPTTNPTPDPTTGPTSGGGATDPTSGGGTTDPTTNPTTDPTTNPTPGPISGGGSATPNDPPVNAPDLSDLSSAPVGFTTLTKSIDTQVIYVSNSKGKDTNNGLSEQAPVKTLARGVELLRADKPDWLLLKAGDVWEGQTLELTQGGAGTDKPLVVSAYGEGPRPMIIPAHGGHGLKTFNQNIRGLVIQGLHIYGATRDPASPKFVARPGEVEGIVARINSSTGKYIKGLVIEDCIVTHFDNNIIVVDDWARNQGEGMPGRVQVTIRRNIIRFATSTDSHAIGIYLEGTHDSVVEQNLLDHNGWAQTDPITIRNKRGHNVYAQRFNGPITFRYNIFSRAGCAGLQLRAGGDIEHNLFVRNATAFWASINDSKANYNVVLESDDMDPDIGDMKRGMGIEGWGMNRYELIGNVVARRVGSLQRPGIDVTSSTLIVKNNIVYAWADERVGVSINAPGVDEMSGNLTQESFGGKEPPFVDPNRSVDSYAKTIGLEPTLAAFVEAAASRPRGQWIDELASDAVCRYIRNGFELIPHD